MKDTVQKLLARGKGILAADESEKSIAKRLSEINLEATPENVKAYRNMFFTTPNIENHISGVILYKDSLDFIDLLTSKGIVCGIKVDEGLESFNETDEQITKGLETLDERLKEFSKYNLKFAKWRGVFKITDIFPSDAFFNANLEIMAKYAKICQDNNILPIVEPEVLLDGNHTTTRSAEIIDETLKRLSEKLKEEGVDLSNLILKTSMALPGPESGVKPFAHEVANATLRSLRRAVPNEVPGIAFLSGGQESMDAINNLNEIVKVNKILEENKKDWDLTFSYGRALQKEAKIAWGGKEENVSSAQEVFTKFLTMASKARMGEL